MEKELLISRLTHIKSEIHKISTLDYDPEDVAATVARLIREVEDHE